MCSEPPGVGCRPGRNERPHERRHKNNRGYYQETVPKAVSGTLVMLCSAVLLMVSDWRIGGIFFLMNLTQLIPILVYEKWTRQISEYQGDRKQLEQELYDSASFSRCFGLDRFFVGRLTNRFQTYLNRCGKQLYQLDAKSEMLDYLCSHGVQIGTMRGDR